MNVHRKLWPVKPYRLMRQLKQRSSYQKPLTEDSAINSISWELQEHIRKSSVMLIADLRSWKGRGR
jgi:hypothetical protein